MKKFRLGHLCLAVSLASLPVFAADLELAGSQPTLVGNGASDGDWGKSGYSAVDGKSVYIVELSAAPVATYDGNVKGYKATSNRSTGAKKLNTNSKESKAYRKFLKKNQFELPPFLFPHHYLSPLNCNSNRHLHQQLFLQDRYLAGRD